ncbi:aspartate/glutamate racemase family protein [Rhizobium sp. FY34]|uniref:aspartate/glutamate racemase family protein n=1 Tax=Rhizobium sp. FY34 TaxID=2562309 RepID=UPI0010BF6CF8|nr:aspartate/glutamate racemase family protein [Rhizobium sp. FY34]
MTHIVLINPNTRQATTSMMAGIVRDHLPPTWTLEARTARRGVAMIVNDAELAEAASGVVELGLEAAGVADGFLIAAFGDPGAAILRAAVTVPVVGLCEAGMLAAATEGRRFAIATVTPDLVGSFAAKAAELGLADRYAGTWLTQEEPRRLAADPEALQDALEIAVRQCFELDDVDAVIIGGGPLGQAAEALSARFQRPVIAPLRAAADRLAALVAEADR